jgi:hypothetical protein
MGTKEMQDSWESSRLPLPPHPATEKSVNETATPAELFLLPIACHPSFSSPNTRTQRSARIGAAKSAGVGAATQPSQQAGHHAALHLHPLSGREVLKPQRSGSLKKSAAGAEGLL